jgi:hypothetical protein
MQKDHRDIDKDSYLSMFCNNERTLFFIVSKQKDKSEIAPLDFVRQKQEEGLVLLSWTRKGDAKKYLTEEIRGEAHMRVEEFRFSEIEDVYLQAGVSSKKPIVKIM